MGDYVLLWKVISIEIVSTLLSKSLELSLVAGCMRLTVHHFTGTPSSSSSHFLNKMYQYICMTFHTMLV